MKQLDRIESNVFEQKSTHESRVMLRRTYDSLLDQDSRGYRLLASIGRVEHILEPFLKLIHIDRPIFIIGAPRSGTTILYQLLARHPDLAFLTQASDLYPNAPILANLIFRFSGLSQRRPVPIGSLEQWAEHGFEYAEGHIFWSQFPLEQDRHILDANDATDQARGYYRGAVRKHLLMFNRSRFINKAPLNSLRIGYLNAIFPNALFIHIHRDGRAVARSILEQRIRHGGPQTAWGPHPENWDLIQNHEPLVACGLQWESILDSITRGLALIKPDRYLTLRYDTLIQTPTTVLRDLLSFCGLTEDKRVLDAGGGVRDMDHKWRAELTPEQVRGLQQAIGDSLSAWGYLPSPGKVSERDSLTLLA